MGEIESVIRKAAKVKDCAVITQENSADKLLCAYVVMQNGVLDVNAVKAAMQAHLPDYMIPSYMMQIDNIPMTKNGKLNKKALPEIVVSTNQEYVAPRNQTEELLCQLFSSILELDKVSVRDNFFELGGHSLRAIRLLTRWKNVWAFACR